MTIIIADDHPLFRGAMRQALAGMAGNPTIIEAGDFTAAQAAAVDNASADLDAARSDHAGRQRAFRPDRASRPNSRACR